MRILFITKDFSGASLCARLWHEGHEMRAYIKDARYSNILDGRIQKIDDMESGLEWMGMDGLIVCDDNGFGDIQDSWRALGYSVIGGSTGGDRLESDREYAQQVFFSHGLCTIPTYTFDSVRNAADFVQEKGGEWVVKQNGHSDKTSCYVGQLPDGRDVIDFLLHGIRRKNAGNGTCVLQRRIHGIEIGVARYFNGTDWVGPIEMNIEHKKFFPGDIGPKTGEMGTLLWYDDNEDNRLFREVLAPLKTHLRQIGFRGDVDINCMVNPEGAWPMEATTRFGYPAVQAQMALHQTSWGNFLKSVADGSDCDLRWRRGYAVAILIAVPPFPFCTNRCKYALSPRGMEVHFRNQPDQYDWQHIHFDSVKIEKDPCGNERYIISDDTGYVLNVTGHGDTVGACCAQTYRIAGNIVIPRMYYRHDIGDRFATKDRHTLEKWGWLLPEHPVHATAVFGS